MANCRFGELVKHGRLAFNAGPVYGFDDPDAVPYFVAMGWAEETSDPADLTIPVDELDIDPFTLWGTGPDKANFVMPDRAAAAAADLGRELGDVLAKARSGLDPRDSANWEA